MMQVIDSAKLFHSLKGPLVLAAGFFDGVHLGHRRVFEGAVKNAARLGGEAWALTFDRHPRNVLDPENAPPLISPLAGRLELLDCCGLAGTYLQTFTKELAAESPEEFVQSICGGGTVAEIHCGANWRFGARAAGTPELLGELGKKFGCGVVVAPAVEYKGGQISSTRIRSAVRDGLVEDAKAMLGRPYSVRETVVHGREVARKFGIPTANFSPQSDLMPSVGVYAVETVVDGKRYAGTGSVGFRPTFADARPDKPVLEVHLIDYSGDLYGRELDIAFVSRLRDEKKFASGDDLFAQIRCDIENARKICEVGL